MGLMFSDHLQPGSRTSREAVKSSPKVTTPTLPFSKVLVSSGESRLFRRYAQKLWIGDFVRHAVYLPEKVTQRAGALTPVGRIHRAMFRVHQDKMAREEL